jgi:hypothetical protein
MRSKAGHRVHGGDTEFTESGIVSQEAAEEAEKTIVIDLPFSALSAISCATDRN